MLNKAGIGSLIRAIYDGKVDVFNLPKKLYLEIYNHLKQGVYVGFGQTIQEVEYESPDYKMLKELRENVQIFSGAKTFNYVLETEGLIVEGDEVLPFQEFKRRALEVYNQYNVTWLEAEYDTAIGQAQNARAWMDIQKSPFDLVKRVAVVDANTSEVCIQYNGIVKPRSDDFWQTTGPMSHYRCRCLLQSVPEGEIDDRTFNDFPIKPLPVFQNQSGITGEVFTKDHPYFTEIPTKYRKLAKKNFNLPVA